MRWSFQCHHGTLWQAGWGKYGSLFVGYGLWASFGAANRAYSLQICGGRYETVLNDQPRLSPGQCSRQPLKTSCWVYAQNKRCRAVKGVYISKRLFHALCCRTMNGFCWSSKPQITLSTPDQEQPIPRSMFYNTTWSVLTNLSKLYHKYDKALGSTFLSLSAVKLQGLWNLNSSVKSLLSHNMWQIDDVPQAAREGGGMKGVSCIMAKAPE